MFAESCDHHLHRFEGLVISPKEKPVPISRHALRPPLLYSLWLRVCPCWTFPVNGILRYAGFLTGFFSLSITFSGSFRVVAYVSEPFLRRPYSIPLCGQTQFYLSADGHLGRFDLLAIVNDATVTIHIEVSLGTHTFISLG